METVLEVDTPIHFEKKKSYRNFTRVVVWCPFDSTLEILDRKFHAHVHLENMGGGLKRSNISP